MAVPTGILALICQGDTRFTLAITSYTALWVVFVSAIRKNLLLLEQQKPKFKVSCRRDIPSCSVLNTPQTHRYLRLLVETIGSIGIENCCGHLIRIEKDGDIVFEHERKELPFAPSEKFDALAKTIQPKVPYHLDVLTIDPNGNVMLATRGFVDALPIGQNGQNVLIGNGEYKITVVVTGKDVPSVECKLKFVKGMNRDAATLEKIET